MQLAALLLDVCADAGADQQPSTAPLVATIVSASLVAGALVLWRLRRNAVRRCRADTQSKNEVELGDPRPEHVAPACGRDDQVAPPETRAVREQDVALQARADSHHGLVIYRSRIRLDLLMSRQRRLDANGIDKRRAILRP